MYQNLLDKSLGEHADEVEQLAEDLDLPPTPRVTPSREELSDLLTGRPGWHLETSLTPGAPPVWCFRSGGKVEFSVNVERNSIEFNVWETNEGIRLPLRRRARFVADDEPSGGTAGSDRSPHLARTGAKVRRVELTG